MSQPLRNTFWLVLILFATQFVASALIYLLFFNSTLGNIWLSGLIGHAFSLYAGNFIALIVVGILAATHLRVLPTAWKSSTLAVLTGIVVLVVLSSFFVQAQMTLFNPLHEQAAQERYPRNAIIIDQVIERPVTNDPIAAIEFRFVISPETPIPDGTYPFNGASLKSYQEFSLPNRRSGGTLQTNTIGLFPNREVQVRNNEFSLRTTPSMRERIVDKELPGPYLVLVSNSFYDYGEQTTTYEIQRTGVDNFASICRQNQATTDTSGHKTDECGVDRGEDYLLISYPHQTNNYDWQDFT